MQRRRHSFPALMAFSLFLLTQPALAAMYKWVDEQGNVHYSQTPPPGTKTETVKPPPPPASGSAAQGERLKEAVEGFNERQEERAKTKDAKAEDAAVKEALAKNCEIAKQNLENLNRGGVLLSKDRETGEYSTVDEESRQKRIAEAQKQIKEFCK